MKVPVRLNRAGWGPLPRRICFPDPALLLRADAIQTAEAFSELVSLVLVHGTYKTTRPGRHPQSDRLLLEALRGARPVVLDVGASDGSTSLDLLAALAGEFRAYYVTDKAPGIRAFATPRGTFFYGAQGECILVATARFVLYPTAAGPGWRGALRRLHGAIPPFDPAYQEVPLIQPRLREIAGRDPRVVIRAYDVFEPWDGPPVTAVKAANLLNRSYFSDVLIRQALGNLWRALEPDGLLLVIDNRALEQASLFRRAQQGFVPAGNVRGGTDIRDLVLGT
jgi:hypothetical protein